MTNLEKVVIGSTVIIAVSAVSILVVSKKYENATETVIENLKDVRYTLSKSREDIIVGNKEIVEGNKLLKLIVKQSADAIATKYPHASFTHEE